jgi:glycosyltransferase involved in cell wall biosynthesis
VLSRIGAYATPHCRGILFHSQNALLRAKGLFEKLELDRSAEVSAFLAKARAVYPSLEPQSAKFMARTGKTPTILFMAGDFAEKGGDIALRVFDKLLERHTRANLVYVGPIPAEAKAAHQQTLSRIRYTDVVPRQEALALLASSDVLLVPTRYESFGFVFLEAMAHGCAPMTYWGEGFNVTRELIDADRTGVLLERPAEPLSAEAEASRFCEKLLELLENRARLKAMQQAALAEVAEGRFCLAKRNRLVRELLRAPPEPSTVEARYRSHRHICFEASTFEQMIDAYRRAHQIPRTLRI